MSQSKAKESVDFGVHLFFDVFIEDAVPGIYLGGDPKRFKIDHEIRSKDTQYKYQTKIDITRYSLYSYAILDWKSVTIRVECQNPKHHFIYDEIKTLFPKARILRERSATSKEFHDALNDIDCKDNEWVFFSPNNDHPFLADPKDFYELVASVKNLDFPFEPDAILSIPFSHFTETNNMGSIFSSYWGYYADIYSKTLFQNDVLTVLKLNKMLLDSVNLYRLKDLKYFFSNEKNINTRVIRIEDTEHYLSQERQHYIIAPKVELCRHYDGYSHIIKYVPPLFIPYGFFEKAIHLVYGDKKCSEQSVLINPFSNQYCFEEKNGADLRCLLEDIPFFWKTRIKKVTNSYGNLKVNKNKLKYYRLLNYPKGKNPVINICRSIKTIFINKLKLIVKRILKK